MLNEPALKDWLREGSEDKTKARLLLVMKLEFSSSDRSAITDHVKGKKDLEELRKVSSFFLPQKKERLVKFCLTNQCFGGTKVVICHSSSTDVGLLY